eukprot:6304060-Amphidinium_carterae.2
MDSDLWQCGQSHEHQSSGYRCPKQWTQCTGGRDTASPRISMCCHIHCLQGSKDDMSEVPDYGRQCNHCMGATGLQCVLVLHALRLRNHNLESVNHSINCTAKRTTPEGRVHESEDARFVDAAAMSSHVTLCARASMHPIRHGSDQ